MNRENVIKWVNALRSGEYSQTTGRLGDDKGYCCLGVAPEVAIKNGVEIERREVGHKEGYPEYQVQYKDDLSGSETVITLDGPLWETATLPTPARNWLGIIEANPAILLEDDPSKDFFNLRTQPPRSWYVEGENAEDKDYATAPIKALTLAELNDSGDFNFSQIADVIVYFWLDGDTSDGQD